MDNKHSYPTLTIQSDWNEVLRIPKGEAWIAAKYLNEPSYQGTLNSSTLQSDNKVKITATEGFQVLSHTTTNIVIKHLKSNLVAVFVAPMKTYQVHKKGIHSISASENALVVSSCADDKLLVWDSRTGETQLELTGHGGPVYKCLFFPSGVVVLSAGADCTLKVWSAETGASPVKLKGHTMAVTDMAIVERGRNVVSVSRDGKAKLWDVGEANCIADILKADGEINCCCLNVINENHTVANEREVGTGNKVLFVGCEDGSIQCAKVALRQTVFKKRLESPVNCCASITDNKVLVGLQSGQVLLLSLVDGSTQSEWFESASPVNSLLSLPNQTFIVGCQDGRCTMMSLQPQHSALRVQLTGSDCDPIRDLSYNGRWIFTACRDACIRKYDTNQLSVHFK